VSNILSKLSVPFVLVTGDSDLSITNTSIHILDSPLLVQWFAQNAILKHPKLIQMPIGLDYHTIFANPHHEWASLGESPRPLDQENLLLSIRNRAPALHQRMQKIYVNFGWISKDRHEALQNIPSTLLFTQLSKIKRTVVWKHMATTAFVLSPFGNGLDCHRTWEALVLGAIPIIRGHHFDDLFKGLPVLIVNEWSDITENLLKSTVERFGRPNYQKLDLAYWTTLIRCSTVLHPIQNDDLD
jgi:hypothetical protein